MDTSSLTPCRALCASVVWADAFSGSARTWIGCRRHGRLQDRSFPGSSNSTSSSARLVIVLDRLGNFGHVIQQFRCRIYALDLYESGMGHVVVHLSFLGGRAVGRQDGDGTGAVPAAAREGARVEVIVVCSWHLDGRRRQPRRRRQTLAHGIRDDIQSKRMKVRRQKWKTMMPTWMRMQQPRNTFHHTGPSAR
jgi:hypothetical protein